MSFLIGNVWKWDYSSVAGYSARFTIDLIFFFRVVFCALLFVLFPFHLIPWSVNGYDCAFYILKIFQTFGRKCYSAIKLLQICFLYQLDILFYIKWLWELGLCNELYIKWKTKHTILLTFPYLTSYACESSCSPSTVQLSFICIVIVTLHECIVGIWLLCIGHRTSRSLPFLLIYVLLTINLSYCSSNNLSLISPVEENSLKIYDDRIGKAFPLANASIQIV